jgi:hypothetical protein
MSAGESAAHLLLKNASLHWARENGYRCGALEVRVPNSNYRADAAAYRPVKGRRDESPPIGLTAIFECKAHRPDYLKDARPEQETRDRLSTCRRRMEKLQRLLGTHHPHLSRGETLFPEFDRHDFSDLQHDGFQKLAKEIEVLERRLHGKTKFDRLLRYRCANALFAVVAPGIMSEEEVPVGWGLLELDPDDDELRLVRQPKRIDTPDRHRLELLERIAAKAMPWKPREAS